MDWQIIPISLIILCLFFYNWTRRKLYLLSAKLPGPLALPVVGNGLTLICKSEDLLNRILSLTTPYKSPSRLWLGPRLIVMIKDPDQLQVLMQSSKLSTKAFIYRFIQPLMGRGLFTTSGLEHKNSRKLFQPLFGAKFLESYSHLFQKHATKFAEQLRCHVDKEPFDVLFLLHDSAFESTMDILVKDTNNHSIDYKYFPESVRRFYHIFIQRVTSFWIHPEWIYRKTDYYKEQQEILDAIIAFTEEIKAEKIPKILERLECKDSTKNNETRIPSILETMVEMIFENPECLRGEDVREHMLTFIATSQDTQSSAIAFTLMMLGMHPEIQAKVVEELQEVLGGKKILDFDDVAKLKYMEMCIKESLRLFPLGPFLPRDVIEDVQFEKMTLPAGCTVIFDVYEVQRDPKLWEKPEEFYPEHFAAEAASKRHPFAFLPFSAGPRRCIAQQYSYVNMKIIIATILQNYAIECPGGFKDMTIVTDVSIRPKDGYLIKIKKRQSL